MHASQGGTAEERQACAPGAVCLPQLSATLQVGFGIALEYALSLGMDWIWARVRHLAALLRERLNSLPGVTVHDHGRVLCGIVSFTKVKNSFRDHFFRRTLCRKCHATMHRAECREQASPEQTCKPSTVVTKPAE
jgi:selenocysteine lyase/cysteine desulfurase